MSSAKSIFLLLTVVLAIGSAIATPFYMADNPGKCCSKDTGSKECHKPAKEEKKSCSKDYCNPFQSCSTTPIVIARVLNFQGYHLSVVRKYPQLESGNASGFSDKHWQPPKV